MNHQIVVATETMPGLDPADLTARERAMVGKMPGRLISKRQYGGTKETDTMTWMEWYDSLAKPTWTPAPATIGLIWRILYPVIIVTFGFVFVQAMRRKVPWQVALPFAINLVSNLIFTPIQFGMRNLPLASIDILVVWGTIIWMAVAIWWHYRWVAFAQVLYFVWVSMATVLQLSITLMNW